jgi:hypothetical protein
MAERYMALNGKYLADADRLLAEGDFVQASEKYWGAAAQIVKAIAERRGWRHSSHRDLRSAVSQLYRETGEEVLLSLFSDAEALHRNFYENELDGDVVRVYATHIHDFIERLESQTT